MNNNLIINNFSTLFFFYTDVHLQRHIKMLLLMLYMDMYHFDSFLSEETNQIKYITIMAVFSPDS